MNANPTQFDIRSRGLCPYFVFMGLIFLIINTFSLTAINPQVFVMRHIYSVKQENVFSNIS